MQMLMPENMPGNGMHDVTIYLIAWPGSLVRSPHVMPE